MIKVSVIIPNYNHGVYLKQRVESVINQTYQNIEIIILDDCSTDHSRSIIETYRNHPKISNIVYNEANSGSPFKQWLKGINIAQGEYIWIAESDDYAKETFISESLTPLEEQTQYSCSFAQCIWVDECDIEFAKPKHDIFTEQDLIQKNFVKNKMLNGCYLYNASAVIFRKSAFLKYKDEITFNLNKYRYSGDWIFWIYILKVGKVALINNFLSYFRRHQNALTKKGELNSESLLEFISIVINIIKIYKIKLAYQDNIKIADRLIELRNKIPTDKQINVFNFYAMIFKINFQLPLLTLLKVIKRDFKNNSIP